MLARAVPSDTDTVAITVTAVNDAPVLSNVPGTATYTEGATGTVLASALTLTDVDTANISRARVWITTGLQPGDTLSADTTGTSITVSYNATIGSLNLFGPGTAAQFEQVLRTVAFSSSSDDPTDAGGFINRTVNWQVNDGAAQSGSLFQTQQTYATVGQARAIATSDFNGDGKFDIAVTNSSTGNVSILLGNGDGTFQTQTPNSTGSGSAPIGIALSDFNHDGKTDIVTANSGTNNVSILLGIGDGTFQAQQSSSTGAGSSPWAIASADFDRDGNADVVTANSGTNNVSILRGNGNGTFQTQTPVGLVPRRSASPWATSTATASLTSSPPMPVPVTSRC